jgi:hypothetical protein
VELAESADPAALSNEDDARRVLRAYAALGLLGKKAVCSHSPVPLNCVETLIRRKAVRGTAQAFSLNLYRIDKYG